MTPIKIESIIKRDPPTHITLGNKHYQFEVDEHGRHVCELTDQAHIARLLSISEGYRLALDGAEPAPVEVPQPIAAHDLPTAATFQPSLDDDEDEGPEVLLGSDVHPAVIDIGNGKTVQLGEVVQEAFEASGFTLRQWNDQDEDERYAKIDAALDAMAAKGAVLAGVQNEDGSITPLEDLPHEELVKIAEDAGIPTEGKTTWDLVRGIQDEPFTLHDDIKEPAPQPQALDREALAQQYEAKFGHRPNGKLSAAKIQAALNEADK